MPLPELVLTPSLGLSLAVILASTAAIVLFRDWRVLLPALMAHYVMLGALIAHITEPNIIWGGIASNTYAIVTPLAGLVATLVIGLTMVQVRGSRMRKLAPDTRTTALSTHVDACADIHAHPVFTQDHVLHFLTLLMCAAATYAIAKAYPVMGNPYLDVTFYWLALSGLFVLVFARNLLKIGLGLLVALSSVILLQSVSIAASAVTNTAVSSAVIILVSLVTSVLCVLLWEKMGTFSLDELRRR